jgi:DNA-binding phage protein
MTERRSLVDKLREEHPLDMAAAGAAVHAVAMMNTAMRNSGLSREGLAEALGVTVERVDEILDGDGNVRIATLARVLKATGRDLNMEARLT